MFVQMPVLVIITALAVVGAVVVMFLVWTAFLYFLDTKDFIDEYNRKNGDGKR